MKHNERNFDERPEGFVHFVDYRSNRNLSGMQVSFHWWDAAHTTLHYHNHYEFFIVTAGRTRHTLNGRQQVLEAGALHLIRPQDVHQFAPVGQDKCTHINISATGERFGQLCTALGIASDRLAGDEGPLRVTLARDEMAYFMGRAQQLNYQMRGEGDPALIQLIVSEMLAQAIALVCKSRMTPRDDRPAWLRDVLEQLHAPEWMDCDADDVYRMSGYSAPVVIRHFKRHTGETVRSYLVKLKMDWAAQLLRTTDMTALEVSAALGYASLSHFGKLFRQHTGRSPRDFRAQGAGALSGEEPTAAG